MYSLKIFPVKQEDDMNLIDVMKRAAEQSAGKIFLKYGKNKLTFKQFSESAARLSAGLTSLGVKKGDRVILLLNNSLEFVVSYFAILNSGAEVVPLNTFLRQEEIVYIIKDCKAKVFITSPDFQEQMKGFNSNITPSLENIITVEDISGLKSLKYNDVLKQKAALIPAVDIGDNDVAVIIYTSGTTGHPKGAMLTHKNLVSNVDSSVRAIKIVKKDRFVTFLPMFHAFTFTVCVLLPLYLQCTITVIKSIQPFSSILKAIMFDRISVFVAIPQVYNVLVGKKIPGFFKWINPIRVCVSGAAPLAGEVLRKFEEKLKVPLIEGYGLSEASPVVSVNPLDGVRKAGSVGPAVPDVEVKIADENGLFLNTGEIGEIAVKGPNIMKGYFNREIETKEILRNGWLYTGDIGKIDDDGYIYILDRKKDLILVNGMNLYPREVEEVLYKNEAVLDAAVVGIKDETHGEIPIGIIQLKEGMSVTDQELRKFCKPHLANYKLPHRFEFWKELPRTGTGKVLKREIKRILKENK
jgi:long-chain acyl-CoA synthetase